MMEIGPLAAATVPSEMSTPPAPMAYCETVLLPRFAT